MEAVRNVESALRAGDQQTEEGEGEGERERLARERRGRETKDELVNLERLGKVQSSLKTIVARKLERMHHHKMKRGPLRERVGPKLKHSFRTRKRHQRHHRHGSGENGEEDSDLGDEKTRKERRRSWVVGQFGGGVRNRSKGDEEELKHLRNMGVVRERLKEREKVRSQAVKFFKHRYELDPESTQKSSCILVTGYEEGAGQNAAELIRQQSTVVINNFFNQPTNSRAVLSRLTSAQRQTMEKMVRKRNGDFRHTISDPVNEQEGQNGGGSFQGAEGAGKRKFSQGMSLDERRFRGEGLVMGAWGKGSHGNDHVIPEAPPTHQSRFPMHVPKTTPPTPPLAPLSLEGCEAAAFEEEEDLSSTVLYTQQYSVRLQSRHVPIRARIVSDSSEDMDSPRSDVSPSIQPSNSGSLFSRLVSSQLQTTERVARRRSGEIPRTITEETDSDVSSSVPLPASALAPSTLAMAATEPLDGGHSVSFRREERVSRDIVTHSVKSFSSGGCESVEVSRDRKTPARMENGVSMLEPLVSPANQTTTTTTTTMLHTSEEDTRGTRTGNETAVQSHRIRGQGRDASVVAGNFSPRNAQESDVVMASPPPRLNRSTSYCTAMETEDVVAKVTAQSKPKRTKSARASISREKEERGSQQSRRKKFGFSLGSRFKSREVKGGSKGAKVVNGSISELRNGFAELPESERCVDGVGTMGVATTTVTLSEGARIEERGEEDIAKKEAIADVSAQISPKCKPADTADVSAPKSKPGPPSPPSPPFTPPPVSPSPFSPPPRPTRHHLKHQFSIASLPGHEMTTTRFYTPLSPRIDNITGTYDSDNNPFAADFDRAMRRNSSSACPPPPVARTLTQLPDDAAEDEGFQEFLRTQNAKPTRSLYITYKIMMISEQIDSKYSDHLNEALTQFAKDENLTWASFSFICRQLMFKGEGLKDGLFMVPAFGRRLLGFLPEMRDVIASYTQDVFDEYATEWLLMRGGWGELLRHYDSEEGEAGRERGQGREGEGDYTLDNDDVWAWYTEDESCSDNSSEAGEREEGYQTAMGFGLVTPARRREGRTLTSTMPATTGVDVADGGGVVNGADFKEQEGIFDDCTVGNTLPNMGSDLFLAPVHEIVPPIGRGLRRVISVEVLFSSDDCGTQWTQEREGIRALSRVSSLPSIASSIFSPTSPISIPSRKRLSTDHSTSSGLGMSPTSLVFSPLPHQRGTNRPPSLPTLSPLTDLRRQSSAASVDSGIRLFSGAGSVAGGVSPSSPASSPYIRRTFEPSQLAQQHHRNSDAGLPRVTEDAGYNQLKHFVGGPNGCGQTQATPISNGKGATPTCPTDNSVNVQATSKTPPTTYETTPTPSNKATPSGNKGELPPQRRSMSDSSDGYASYGLESENDRTTEWEWTQLLGHPLLPLAVATALLIACYVLR